MKKFNLKKYSPSQYIYISIGILLLFLMLFIRTYHFGDWLNFKWDQARDGFIAANAVENGPQFLPLLGPRATDVGQTEYLRLGPAYYYLQYLSAIIFHSVQPTVLALPDLFFSTLAIVALFFLLRIYFSTLLSATGAVLYGTSFLVLQYSRFAWNPNSTSFFVIVFLYSLIKLFNSSSQKRPKWVVILAICFSIGTQLHFFTFFLLIGTLGGFLVYKLQPWKKNQLVEKMKLILAKPNIKLVGLFLLITSFFYLPVIGNEIITHGENSRHFLSAFKHTSEPKPLYDKLLKAAQKSFENYTVIITTFHYENEDLINSIQTFLGLFLYIWASAIAGKRIIKEKNSSQKDFLFLILFLPVIFYIISLPVAFQLRPRFFVSIFSLPFVFLLMIFSSFKKNMRWVWVMITLLIIALNLSEIYNWFNYLALAEKKAINSQKYFILKMKEGSTLSQLEEAADYLIKTASKEGPIYQASERDYGIVLAYLFYTKGQKEMIKDYSLSQVGQPFYALYYFRSNGFGIDPNFRQDMKILEKKNFGQLTLIKAQQSIKNNIPLVPLKKDPNIPQSSHPRLFWKDIWHSSIQPKITFDKKYFE